MEDSRQLLHVSLQARISFMTQVSKRNTRGLGGGGVGGWGGWVAQQVGYAV